MGAGAHFLADLAIVLGVAAVTTVLFHKLRQPVVLGYLLAGLIIGPHVEVPLVADVGLVSTLSELGVILLMFSIGLEFSIGKIARVGASAAFTAAFEVGLMVALGYLAGQLLGWNATESLFLGGCLGISSTMLVAKAFEEQKLVGGFTEVVFAILVFEDMIAILLLAVLTAVSSGAGMSPSDFLVMAGKLAGFLIAMLVGGLLIVPRFVREIVKLDRSETLLVASMAICFGMAYMAEAAGYSVALGAFLGGMLVSESGKGAQVEHIIQPFRDVFAAIFFVAVGMTIEPALIARHWLPIVVLTVLVLVGKMLGVTVGVFLSGNGLRRSVRAGMSLAQIGEFSFIIAGLGVASGATPPFLLPIVVAVSCLTALLTPWLIRGSDRAAAAVDSRLPGSLQTFVTFYGSWIDNIRAAPPRQTVGAKLRRSALLLIVDAVMLGATVIGTAVLFDRILAELTGRLALAASLARVLIVTIASVIVLLFLIGVLRRAQKIAKLLAGDVVPAGVAGKVDLGTAPRRALVMTLELAIVLVVGLPLVAIVQPFVETGLFVFAALAAVIAVIALMVWRSISNLQGHVRAGSELIVEALQRQSRHPTAPIVLDDVRALLPGIPGLSPLRLAAGSPAIGQSLAQLNVRALTGATVLAINRGPEGSVLPSAGEVLREGDVLALAGPADAIEAARALLL